MLVPKVSILERFDCNGRQKATLGVHPTQLSIRWTSLLDGHLVLVPKVSFLKRVDCKSVGGTQS